VKEYTLKVKKVNCDVYTILASSESEAIAKFYQNKDTTLWGSYTIPKIEVLIEEQ